MRLRETFPATCWLLRQAKRRIIFWPVISLLIICATLFTLLRIDAYLFRWKAERLLRTCESLQLTQPDTGTAYRELRQFGEVHRPTDFQRPPRFGEPPVYSYNPNTPKIMYSLSIAPCWETVVFGLMKRGHYSLGTAIVRIAGLAGDRGGFLNVRVSIGRDDLYATSFTASSVASNPEPGEVVVRTSGDERFSFGPSRRNLDLAYQRPSGCYGCVALWVTYAANASPATIHDAFNLDLHCFTSMHACMQPNEMMPRLWEEQRLAVQVPRVPLCSPYWLTRAGRERMDIALARVVSIRAPREHEDSGWEVRLSPMEMLQGDKKKMQEPVRFWTDPPETWKFPPPDVMPVKDLRPGVEVLALRGGSADWLCQLIIPSKQNIALVKDSIKRYKAEFGSEPSPIP